MRALGNLGRERGRFRSLPLAGGWTNHRDMPAPEGATFMQQYVRWRAEALGMSGRDVVLGKVRRALGASGDDAERRKRRRGTAWRPTSPTSSPRAASSTAKAV